MVFVEFVVYEILALYAGWIGVAELSAMALVLNFQSLVFTVSFGLHLTVCVFVGNSLGEENSKMAIRYAKFSAFLGAFFMGLICVIFILIKE